MATGATLLTLTGHMEGVFSAVFSPDGRHIVSASEDTTLKVWDAYTGAVLAVFYADSPLFCCAWSPDGAHIIAGGEGGCLYWLRWVE